MDDLRQLYRDALRVRLEALAASRAALGPDGVTSAETSLSADEAALAARRIAHALRGSGGTYGFPEVSRAAAAVEDAEPARLADHVDSLMQVLQQTIAGGDA